MLAESVNDVATVQQNAMRSLDDASQDMVRQSQVLRELQQNLMRMRMVQFGSISDRLYRVVRQAAKELGKRVALDIRGASVEVDRGVLERMANPVEHLLRNAVAHGIEPPAQREAAGGGTSEIRVGFARRAARSCSRSRTTARARLREDPRAELAASDCSPGAQPGGASSPT